MQIALQQFQGEIPKTPPRYLSEKYAQKAENCKLGRTHLEAWQDVSKIGDLTKTGDIESIYLFDGQYWFHWAEDVDVVEAPIAGDVENKTVFTVNDGNTTKPKITDATIATSGGSGDLDAYPLNYYNVGVPAPVNAISASNSPSCDEKEQESVVYIYTYVNEYGFEGPPSPPSNIVDRCSGDSVSVGNMSTAPTGNYKTSEWAKRLYRAVTGTQGTEYQFVMDLPLTTTSLTEANETDELAEVIPSTSWVAPPDDLEGLIALPNGILVGFTGKDLYFSEPYLPHAWPKEYSLSTNENIVGLGSINNSVVVCTEKRPCIVTGSHPSNMSMSYIDVNQACVSKKGIAAMSSLGVVYPSPDGLVVITSGGAEVLTSEVLTKTQWQDLNPSSIKGYVYNDMYFGFYDNGAVKAGFVLTPDPEGYSTGPEFVSLNIYAYGGYTDVFTDTLYLVLDRASDGTYNELMEWENSVNALTYTWRSKIFLKPFTSFSCGKCIADSYNSLSATIYVDGAELFTKTITDSGVFRLPSGVRGREFEIKIQGTDIVQEFYLADSPAELRG